MRDAETARPTAVADAYQDVAVIGQVWLHDGRAWPLVFPEKLAVGKVDAGCSLRAEQQNLRYSVKSYQLW